jgi:hypothetical protein
MSASHNILINSAIGTSDNIFMLCGRTTLHWCFILSGSCTLHKRLIACHWALRVRIVGAGLRDSHASHPAVIVPCVGLLNQELANNNEPRWLRGSLPLEEARALCFLHLEEKPGFRDLEKVHANRRTFRGCNSAQGRKLVRQHALNNDERQGHLLSPLN